MPANKKMHVYLNQLLIGELGTTRKNTLSFRYHEEWLKNERSFPFSLSFPLRESPYAGANVYAYFDNLLPDNISIRRKIALQTKADSEDVYDLLLKIGRDCVGALQLIPQEETAPKLKPVKGIPQTQKQILKTIKDLEFFPLGIGNTKDFRLSLAGMQEKTAYLFYQDQWLAPTGSAPTTHIFKPMMKPEKMPVPLTHSVENEWFCGQLLKEFGIEVAHSEIMEIEKNKILVVERFDRQWRDKGILVRLPQEDLCQAFGVSADKKYEVDGGPGIVKIMKLLSGSQNRNQDRTTFFKTQILFWALAAIDGHAKNFSIFHYPQGFQLTPIYDVISAAPLVHAKKISPHDLKLAMSVGENRHYKIKEIYPRHWQQSAKLGQFSKEDLNEIIESLIKDVGPAISRIQKKVPKSFPAVVMDPILEHLKKKIKLLES